MPHLTGKLRHTHTSFRCLSRNCRDRTFFGSKMDQSGLGAKVASTFNQTNYLRSQPFVDLYWVYGVLGFFLFLAIISLIRKKTFLLLNLKVTY